MTTLRLEVIAIEKDVVEFGPEDGTRSSRVLTRLPRKTWLSLGAPYCLDVTVTPSTD